MPCAITLTSTLASCSLSSRRSSSSRACVFSSSDVLRSALANFASYSRSCFSFCGPETDSLSFSRSRGERRKAETPICHDGICQYDAKHSSAGGPATDWQACMC